MGQMQYCCMFKKNGYKLIFILFYAILFCSRELEHQVICSVTNDSKQILLTNLCSISWAKSTSLLGQVWPTDLALDTPGLVFMAAAHMEERYFVLNVTGPDLSISSSLHPLQKWAKIELYDLIQVLYWFSTQANTDFYLPQTTLYRNNIRTIAIL